jgi:Mg2+ and Co2+ transporter CorA
MSNLRQEMQRNPKLSHISRLHRLARQLATLKRMYETKKIIIDNVLYRQENSLSNRSSIQLQPPPTPPNPHDPAPTLGDPNILGVPLSPTAIAKFERLRDRVKLYALGEIEDCLAEKTELISMTFNLLAMRESQAVERLSRVAIFLTKFTFLFLPLTLITGYFSMQLKDMDDYTQAHFWAASGIFVVLMILILYTVGKSTDTLETGVIWKSVKEMWFPCLGRRKKKKKGGKGGRRSY